MEESEGGTEHLTAVCVSRPVSRLKQGVYRCLTDNHQRCY